MLVRHYKWRSYLTERGKKKLVLNGDFRKTAG